MAKRRGAVGVTNFVVALIAAGCGGSTQVGGGERPCAPGGTTLHLTARATRFSVDCLAAPADVAFTINFDNQDAGVPHTVGIYDRNPQQDPNATQLFNGSRVTGPDMNTYEVGPLGAGTLHFQCDVHPGQMFGTFVVGGPEG